MHVVECDIPSSSMLDRDLIAIAYFHDSYRAPLTHPELGIVDIFFALFAHEPLWMKLALIARNAAARLVGLEAPTVAEIMTPKVKARYSVGDKIGPWPIFFLGDNEIVAGRNNKHSDFRVSVLKAVDGDAPSVVVSTVCTVHNRFGKIYLHRSLPPEGRSVIDVERSDGEATVSFCEPPPAPCRGQLCQGAMTWSALNVVIPRDHHSSKRQG